MKFEYALIKQEIAKRGEKTSFFTKAFLKDFIDAVESRKKAIEDGVDDSYRSGNITLYHSYDKVYASKFYNKNSTAYCLFLEIVN